MRTTLDIDVDRSRPDWRFLLRSPWHMLALGFGSGLPRVAPGTWGTVFAWISFVVLDRWLNDTQMAILIGVTFVLMRFIEHAQVFRRESLGQLLRDEILRSGHGSGLAMAAPYGQSGHTVGRASFLFVKLAGADAASA